MHLLLDSLVVSASSDQPSDIEWLKEFLGPSCAGDDNAARVAARSIRLRTDASVHAAFTARLAEFRSSAVGFVMDGGPMEFPTFRDDDVLVAWDEAFSVFYRILTPHSVEVVDAHDAASDGQLRPRRGRGAMMRVVREWAMTHARGRGSLALHAAGIARSGRALLVAGPKQAGKTTLATACLLHGGQWRLLANDRILLARRAEDWLCRGMASIVSVRSGSMDLISGLGLRLDRVAGSSLARLCEPVPLAPLVDGRRGLSPVQYAAALGASLVEEAVAHTIALPTIDPDGCGIRSRRLAPAEAATRLRSALFAPASPTLRSDLFEVPGDGPLPSEASLMQQVADLASTTACVEVTLGRNAYDGPAIDAWLRTLDP